MNIDYIDYLVKIAALITLIFLALQVYLQRRQIAMQREEMVKQGSLAVLEAIDSDSFRRMLRFVYSREPQMLVDKMDASGKEQLTPEERDTLEEFTALLDRTGYKVRMKLIPKQQFCYMFWAPVVRAAQQLLPYLQNERDRRGEESYKDDFRWLAMACKKYHLEGAHIEAHGTFEDLSKLLQHKPLRVVSPR
jgi:hypothetical protein